jgi:hypothetical protein
MRVGDKISKEELKERDFWLMATYEGSEIWGNEWDRVYCEIGTDIIVKIFNNGAEADLLV